MVKDLKLDNDHIHDMLGKISTVKPDLIISSAGLATEQEGIEIIKHIRLTPWLNDNVRKTPILIYSLDSQRTLLQLKPRNAILLSHGCYFISIFDLNKNIAAGGLSYEKNCLVIVDPFIFLKPLPDLRGLKPFVEVDSQDIILEDRHSIANWWGPVRLLTGLCYPQTLPKDNSVIQTFEEAKKDLRVKKLLFIKEQEQEKQSDTSTNNCTDSGLIRCMEGKRGSLLR